MLAILSGLLRRILGGFWSTVPVIKERGIQWILCFLLYAPVIYFKDYYGYLTLYLQQHQCWLSFLVSNKYIFTAIAALLLIIAETTGHWPGYGCGTITLKTINEDLAKGRTIPYKRILDWWGKVRGFEQYGREWCFWQLILCKTVRLIPVSLLLGCQFLFIGLCVAFVYNACYWVELKPFKKVLVTPSNWGEFFQGCLYFQGLWL